MLQKIVSIRTQWIRNENYSEIDKHLKNGNNKIRLNLCKSARIIKYENVKSPKNNYNLKEYKKLEVNIWETKRDKGAKFSSIRTVLTIYTTAYNCKGIIEHDTKQTYMYTKIWSQEFTIIQPTIWFPWFRNHTRFNTIRHENSYTKGYNSHKWRHRY